MKQGNNARKYASGSLLAVVAVLLVAFCQGQVSVSLKAFLQGPYQGGEMSTHLNSFNFLPLEQPFAGAPWLYAGAESVPAIPNEDIVDWVLIELREMPGTASSSVFIAPTARQAGFILKSGQITSIDGASPMLFNIEALTTLYAAVCHRNHLAVLSGFPLAKDSLNYTFDFTCGAEQTFGDTLALAEVEHGKWALFAGDADGDGQVGNRDKIDVWLPLGGYSGYLGADLNLDGQVNNHDKVYCWKSNSGRCSHVGGNWTCGKDLFDIRDNRFYRTARIGSQCWMAQNLNIGQMVPAASGQNSTSVIEKYCYNNNEANCEIYGGLYQWKEMMQYSEQQGSSGLCPPGTGWRLPSDEDWRKLEREVEDLQEGHWKAGWRGDFLGGRLKEVGTTHWTPPNNGAMNSVSFTALPGGYRGENGITVSQGNNGYFWTSTALGNNHAWSRGLSTQDARMERKPLDQDRGLNVRCIKDLSAVPDSVPYAMGTINENGGNGTFQAHYLLQGEAEYELGPPRDAPRELPPTDKYFAMAWADFFTEDFDIVLALLNKYDFTGSFYFQAKPKSNDCLNSLYERWKTSCINKSGSYQGDHGFLHYPFVYSNPAFDGVNNPSDYQLIGDRGDGTNAFNIPLDQTVSSTVGSWASSWLQLPESVCCKKWSDLSGADCQLIRDNMSVFKVACDPMHHQLLLPALDSLSDLFCGTTGYSVKNGNYFDRIPNTPDGNWPSSQNRIQGGVFQGAATTQNHEIWERLQTIMKIMKQSDMMTHDLKFWGTPGGFNKLTCYQPQGIETFMRYYDTAYSTIADGVAPFNSSITGITRSWRDVLRENGYLATMAAGSTGFRIGAYNCSGRLECQRLYMKNKRLSRADNLCDGYQNALRCFDPTLPVAVQYMIMQDTNSLQRLYDYTATATEYLPLNEYSIPVNFHKLCLALVRNTTWGLIPDGIGDSGTSTDSAAASMSLVFEAVCKFLKQAGIRMISHEEALDICYHKSFPKSVNIWPNPSFLNTLREVFPDSQHCPEQPDGWNEGRVVVDTIDGELVKVLYLENPSDVAKKFFTRVYLVNFGVATVKFRAKGNGTFFLKNILNGDLLDDTKGDHYHTRLSIPISCTDWQVHSTPVEVCDAPLMTYLPPGDAVEKSRQLYLEGTDDRICGLHLEFMLPAFSSLRIYTPVLQID